MRSSRWREFRAEVVRQTPFLKLIVLLVVLWLGFSAALYVAESRAGSVHIDSFGDAMYWAVAAFSTAGIADVPADGLSKLIGAAWIIVGSVMFFGIIVASVTAYFMRPLQRPANQLVDLIEYNLEQLEELSVEELDLLKETVDTLIDNMESVKGRRSGA